MTRYHGRHRAAPTHHTAQFIAGGVLASLPAVMLLNGVASADTPPNWTAISNCESGNQNINNVTYPVSSASGYFQIIDGTWRGAGGKQFASRAIGATKAQQLIVANRIATANPSLSDWDQSRYCWGGKTAAPVTQAKHASGQEAPRHAKVDVARHSGLYTVVNGDTLSRIAASHGTQWQVVFQANRGILHDPDRIFPGQSIAV
jgi:hypothetical protein